MPWLISPAQLDKFRKSQKNVVILDATWYLPTDGKDARAEFMEKHIPGARFLDLSLFHDAHSEVPNMLMRDETYIQEKLSAMGLTHDCKLIIYDNSPLHSSCRALWMFKVFGHHPNQLYVLDGGLSAWLEYDKRFETGAVTSTPKRYELDYQAHYVRTLMQMKTNLHHPKEQVVDLRHAVRFAGGPETRMHMRAGHIPGSFSFPYTTMFLSDGKWKALEKIRKQLVDIGIDFQYPIVSMCGSGMTAATLNFVLDLLQHTDQALYDGSWSEWGSERLFHGEESLSERPVVTSVE